MVQSGNYQKKKIIIPSIIGGLAGGFFSHIAYGAVLGAIVSKSAKKITQ